MTQSNRGMVLLYINVSFITITRQMPEIWRIEKICFFRVQHDSVTGSVARLGLATYTHILY